MSEEMIKYYRQLNTNEKRNEISSLLLKLDQLMNQLMIQNNIDIANFKNVKNYDSINQALNKEDEMLLFLYDDIWNLKNKVLALLCNNQK